MKRYQVSVEVEPIDAPTVERLKAAGHTVYSGNRDWLVEVTATALTRDSVRAEAHVLARTVIKEFGLTPMQDPPLLTLRDPDAGMDERPDLIISDAKRGYDPDPLTRPKRKLYQRVMELGLGERKGD